jgi:hypothetical protein
MSKAYLPKALKPIGRERGVARSLRQIADLVLVLSPSAVCCNGGPPLV